MSTELDPWDDDQPEPVRPNRPPAITRVAGVMWMAVGVVYVLFGCANAALTDVVQTRRPGPIGPSGGTEGCALWLALAIGLGLFVAGKSVAAGKARDVRTAAILSILLGLFYLISGVAYAVFAERDEVLAFVVGGTTLAIAIGCILPALLALVGRSQYREWRLERLADRSYRRRQEEAAEEEAAEVATPQEDAHEEEPQEEDTQEGAAEEAEGDGGGAAEVEDAEVEDSEVEDAVVEEVPEGERGGPARGSNEPNSQRDAERIRWGDGDHGSSGPPSAGTVRPER
jgi:hypothetical protein